MSTLHSEVFRFAHVSHDWLTRLTEDVERWLSSSLGISQAKLGPAGALSIFLASSSLLYFWRTRSRNQSGQGGKPPMIPYWVPWLGSALQVQRDPDALYGKAHRELGPMFGVKAFGMTRYYVADTDLINAVYKQTAAFSGSPIQSVFLQLIFAVREEVIAGSNIFGDMLITKNRHLSPINVHSLVGSFIAHTQTLVEKRDSIVLETPTSLLSIAIPLMQKADCAMLFGPEFLDKHYDIAAPAFETFDANVPLLAVSFPPWLMPGTIAARTLLLDRLTQYFESDVPEDASGQLKDFVELGRSVDWSPRDLAAYALGMMWPLLANAPYAVFWLFAYHLRRPEGLAPILEEVKATVSSGRDLNEVVRDSGATPYLDACISETIRIASDSYSVRWVPAATEVALGGFTFTGGDSVVCNMRGVHMDATIYPNPSEFEPARFLGAGKESVRGRYFPFGGGFSICEGRHFALAQIKAFIIILLSEFDVSLANEREPIPKLSPNNRGFGMIKPLGDVSVRLRPRKL